MPGRARRVPEIRCDECWPVLEPGIAYRPRVQVLPAVLALVRAADQLLSEQGSADLRVELDYALSPACLVGMCTASPPGNPGDATAAVRIADVPASVPPAVGSSLG